MKTLAELVEATRANNNNRHEEICHHWEGNVLGPIPVAHTAKLEKVKDKELSPEWVKCTLLSFLYINKTYKLPFRG